jgi:hypothetical protein
MRHVLLLFQSSVIEEVEGRDFNYKLLISKFCSEGN